MSNPKQPEPWLRGPIAGVHPLVMPVFFSYQQVREDLAYYVEELTPEQIWQDVDAASIGFHLKHMAGSVDRITTYLMGAQLTLGQLGDEHKPGITAGELLALVDEQLRRSEERIRTIDPSTLYDRRTVGRKQLPSTVIGLIVHLAEHTQRHLGQIITLAKAVRGQK